MWENQGIWHTLPLYICGHVWHQAYNTRNSKFWSQADPPRRKSKSSPNNIPNFTNPLVSNMETYNETFNFKETTSQTYRLDFVEVIKKWISVHEDDKHWNMIRGG